MQYILDIDDNKKEFAEEFFKAISFVKKVKAVEPNKITNSSLLKSIENYEKGKGKGKEKVKLKTLSLEELKARWKDA